MSLNKNIRSKAIITLTGTLLGSMGIAVAQTANQSPGQISGQIAGQNAGQIAGPSTAPSVALAQAISPSPSLDTQSRGAVDAKPAVTGASDAESLKQLIGVNPSGLKRVDLPKLPVMSLSGFVRPHDGKAKALLQIVDLNRTFLVEVGTEIPITVPGRLSPIGRSELVGLNQTANPPAQSNDANSQSQIILKVVRVSDEGVTVEAGLIDQTIVVR